MFHPGGRSPIQVNHSEKGSKMIPIYIPSRGRTLHQPTWTNMGPEARENAYIVCPASEVKSHVMQDRKTLSRGDITGISNVRQFIVDFALKNNEQHIIMLDDDLMFNRRIAGDSPKLRKTTQHEMIELWRTMEKLVREQYHHVGLSPRQMNDKHFPKEVKFGMRQNAVHCIDVEAINDLGLRYDSMDLMEDYYMTLSLFSKGCLNGVITDWTWDQTSGSGAVGGCSDYRTPQLQEEASRKLQSLFPKYVKVVEKETKTGWVGMKKRFDVRVQWNKAALDGQV